MQWPAGSLGDAHAPFCIGVLGDDPFSGALEKTIGGESIDHHPMAVRRSKRAEDLTGCQIVFICRSEEDRMADILAVLGSRPVLTVGEIGGFARHGGDINFYLAGGKIRFEINPQAAERSGLKISSQLLTLGRIVAP